MRAAMVRVDNMSPWRADFFFFFYDAISDVIAAFTAYFFR